MKKIASAVILASLVLSAVHAYNPPAGAEQLDFLSSPTSLSGAKSVTGGALFEAGADSIIVNPALTAKEQRVNLNLGYTFLYSSEEYNESQIGHAVQAAMMIPFKLYVFSGYADLVLAPFNEMNLGNSVNAKFGLSKEINDRLDVGLSISGGGAWKYGSDWSLCGNLGFLYNYGNLGFMKDFRIGFSALNLGKVYSDLQRIGLDEKEDISGYPSLATLKFGAAGTVLDTDIAKLGFGLDLTVPCFQNVIFDLNAQVAFKQAFVVSINEKINVMECAKGHGCYIPSISFLFKFAFDVKNNAYLENKGWSQSEMSVSAGYKNLYTTVHAMSVGVDIDLGMTDNEAPKIVLWDDNE